MNMLNKVGTAQDNSTAYEYNRDGIVMDVTLSMQYEENGLFAKIIDTPAEEAVKHGFELGLKNFPDVETYIEDVLDMLDFDERASQAIKWSRLYGGAIGVMFIDDGRGIDEPLDWKNIRGIDEVRIYERAVVWPDYTSLYNINPVDPEKSTTSKFGMPEYYQVNSIYGQFRVHESRCLVFRNGILPERTMQPQYRFWGIPEYIRIKHQMRETITTHSLGVLLLERSVQGVHGMKGLTTILEAEGGLQKVMERIRAVDMSRHAMNTMVIDAEGETYEFKTTSMAGVEEVIYTTCNMLSSVTHIPQTILFGRSPAGQNATGESDLESYYNNYVERIQKLMLRGNLQTLLDIIIIAGIAKGEIEEKPDYKLKFNPLWSMSENEQVEVEHRKAQTSHQKAQTAQMYVDMGVLSPAEIRESLKSDEEFQIEGILEDVEDDDLWGSEDLPTDPIEPGMKASEFSPTEEVRE
jgi:phage-related protein (TIGR01555 family)